MRKGLNTTIDIDLLDKAKLYASGNSRIPSNGKIGINNVIEDALAFYFASCEKVIWEKSLPSGWVKRLILQGDSIFYENIKLQKHLIDFQLDNYSDEELLKRGWQKVAYKDIDR
jgi:hypothetical protein